MCISEEDMQRINEQYKGKLAEWKATAEDDNNVYEITDFSTNYDAKTDELNNKLGDKANTKGDTVVAATSLVGVAENSALGAATVLSSVLSNPISAMISASVTLAVGILYMATQPNKDEARALNELKEMMLSQKEELAVSQQELEQLEAVLIDKAANAHNIQNDGDKKIEEKQKEYDMLMAAYLEIMDKVNNGEPISEEDKATLKAIGENIQALGEEIAELQDSVNSSIGDVNDDISDTEDTYAVKSDEISNSLATTDYAADFDETTKTLASLEIAAQSMNALQGTAVGAYLAVMGSAPFCWYMLAFAALALTGAGLSTSAIVQQSHVLNDVNKELDVRHETQDAISDTTNIFEASYDVYDQSLSEVGDITFEIPENLTGLEDFEIPDINTSGADGNSGSTNPFASPASSPSEGNPSGGTPNNPFASTPSTATAPDDKKNPFA